MILQGAKEGNRGEEKGEELGEVVGMDSLRDQLYAAEKLVSGGK